MHTNRKRIFILTSRKNDTWFSFEIQAKVFQRKFRTHNIILFINNWSMFGKKQTMLILL